MANVKVAVLGTGSLGQHHARIYSELHAAGQVEFVKLFNMWTFMWSATSVPMSQPSH